MKITFADLWRSSGTVDRGTYAVVGLVGFALKHNLDCLVATSVFHRPWGLFNYWVPLRDVARITALSSGDAMFLETMVVLALPFVWVGVALTMKRLRSVVAAPVGAAVLRPVSESAVLSVALLDARAELNCDSGTKGLAKGLALSANSPR